MKTIAALAVISFFSFKAFSQGYQKFAVEGAHWTQHNIYAPNAPDVLYPLGESTEWYKLEGDTIVATSSYKLFYLSSFSTYHFDQINSSTYGSPWSLIGLIREDTVERKVYIRDLNSGHCGPLNEDTLLFDFSRNIHDSIIISLSSCPDCCLKDSFYIDTVVNSFQIPFSGFNRKTWRINSVEDKEFTFFDLYEGIGTSFGFFESPGHPLESGWTSYLDAYCIGPDSVCGRGYLYSSVNNDLADPQVVVFPNPVSDKLFFSGALPNDVWLYASDGKQLVIDFNQQSSSISLSHLNPGIYFLCTRTDDRFFRKRIIKL